MLILRIQDELKINIVVCRAMVVDPTVLSKFTRGNARQEYIGRLAGR